MSSHRGLVAGLVERPPFSATAATIFVAAGRPRWVAVTTFAVLALLNVAGCQQAASTWRPTLATGYQAYRAHDYAAAGTDARMFIQSYPASNNLDEAYYLAAIADEARGKIPAASANYRLAISHSRRPALLAKSYRALGDMAYVQHRFSHAVRDYQRSRHADTAAPVTPWLLFRLGAALQDLGHWRQGQRYLARLAGQQPATAAGRAALRRLEQNHFTLQFGAFTDAAAAWRQAAQLRQAGVPPSLAPIQLHGRKLYLVQSGYYRTYAAAYAARAAVAARFPQVIVTP